MSGMDDLAGLQTASTGIDTTTADLLSIGKKRVNLMRAYNAREGLDSSQDTLPKKLFKKALKGGKSDGLILTEAEFEASKTMYYAQAGWDAETGNPTRETLEACDLAWAADDLGL